MGALFGCAIYCMLLSIWAVIQLVLMGIFYKMETLVLIEDVEPEEYTDYDDFIAKTKANYSIVAINCWIAAVIYLIFIGISYLGIKKAQKSAKLAAQRLEDDEIMCGTLKQKQK
ncbi:hypothetical protein O3G_MSEX006973 [Manduca sexta]|uniref:Uncharacterized protein n=1 Tax=Manduca sexta TaxID=7130 RepID=A0A921Z615_MANSE|nr:hypothetical protein O3G_MSEX006973 [Manduca sexta]